MHIFEVGLDITDRANITDRDGQTDRDRQAPHIERDKEQQRTFDRSDGREQSCGQFL